MIKTARGAKANRVKVTFVLPADVPPASVVGEFNGWDPYANPMKRRSNATRSASMELVSGREYRFAYLLDGGEWRHDPDAETIVNDDGTVDSVLRL